MLNNYDFINHINYQITENNRYSLYKIKRKNIFGLNNKNSFDYQQLVFSTKNLNNNNKRIILVDDEEYVLFTYKTFLENNDYDGTAFTDPLSCHELHQKYSEF